MATEKNWLMSGNVNLDGSSDLTVAQNFMYELYNTLSGGNGNSDAKWEIVSASDGVNPAYSGGPALQPSDFVFAAGVTAHSWFLARKQSMLPQNGGTRYLYFCADCEDTTGNKAYFSFDYTAPTTLGTVTVRPAETSVAWEKDGLQFFTGYDASFPTYYHSVIDTTGSFHIITARGNVSYNPSRFAMTCARLETPRTGTIDPYPVFFKLGYDSVSPTATGYSIGGPWSAAWTNDNDHVDWNDTTQGAAQAMWRTDGTATATDKILILFPAPIATLNIYGYNWNPYGNFGPTASPIDGTWPLMPSYIYTTTNAYQPIALGVRGRLPDVHMGNYQYYIGTPATANTSNLNWLAGATIPATGTPTHACVGQYWMPFSASLQPGLA